MLIKRSFSLAGHRTSVALEAEFWDSLGAMAAAEGMALAGLLARIDAGRAADAPLASVLRVLCLRQAQDAAHGSARDHTPRD